jgi:hypothetical protein
MTFVPKYLASKRWEKVGRQELRSTPYKQEIHPRLMTTVGYYVVLCTKCIDQGNNFQKNSSPELVL